jgi:hypothetical protein
VTDHESRRRPMDVEGTTLRFSITQARTGQDTQALKKEDVQWHGW